MPMNRAEYSPDWEAISRSIREDRAGNCCEQCGVPNYALVYVRPGRRVILTGPDGEPLQEPTYGQGRELARLLKPELSQGGPQLPLLEQITTRPGDGGKVVVVILTTAHLDHDTTNDDPANLRCLCQRCHLNWDRADNQARKSYGRLYRAAHQLSLNFL